MEFSRFRRLAATAVLGAFAAFSPPMAAQAADQPHLIVVSGQGEVSGTPNQAELSAGVSTSAATADAALAENARTMTAVFAALKRLGVPDKAIRTSSFSVAPQYPPYNQNGSSPQRIVGYQVSNQVDVTLDDTRKLGPTLDALVAAGANQINSISFSIRDADTLLEAARTAAVGDAMRRAQTYAKAAGVTLGAVISIQESGVSESPRPMLRAMADARAPVTPTAAGEQSVTASVSMTFEIK
jgi:uncharacterized protein YggE